MAMNVASSPASLRGWSEEEWRVRRDLAALYRLCAHHRWTDWIFTHISARVLGRAEAARERRGLRDPLRRAPGARGRPLRRPHAHPGRNRRLRPEGGAA